MSKDTSSIESNVWNCAHMLKNAGVGYGEYIEQTTCLHSGQGEKTDQTEIF